MSRGLGTRQRAVLAALRAMERERGPGWRTPAEVIATLGEMTGAAPAQADDADPYARFEAAQLAQCRQMVAMGYREFAASVMLIEARIAERAAGRRARARAPNQIRPAPRGGEDGNPSRVLALLERRGMVEREAQRGPGSAVRLTEVRR